MLRSLFIGLSESKRLRHFAEQSPLGLRFSQRFVAGTQLDDVIRATEVVNGWGANVSLKLTHMGFDVSEDLAFGLVTELVDHAVRINNFIRVDMEGSPYTQRTLEFVRGLHREPGHAGRAGTVIQ